MNVSMLSKSSITHPYEECNTERHIQVAEECMYVGGLFRMSNLSQYVYIVVEIISARRHQRKFPKFINKFSSACSTECHMMWVFFFPLSLIHFVNIYYLL